MSGGNERIERLITEGFLFENTSVRGFNLTASYGDGFRESAVIGTPDGLREWKLKINVLPHFDGEYLIDAGVYGRQTRALYFWEFYLRHNVANAFKPFWVRDPFLKRDYLAEIVEGKLDYEMLSARAYSTGLTLRQRRIPGLPTPGDAVLVPNNSEI